MLREIFWNPAFPNKYHIIKYVSIVVGESACVMDVYIGYQLGQGFIGSAVFWMLFMAGFAVINSGVWTWVLETMNLVEYRKHRRK